MVVMVIIWYLKNIICQTEKYNRKMVNGIGEYKGNNISVNCICKNGYFFDCLYLKNSFVMRNEKNHNSSIIDNIFAI